MPSRGSMLHSRCGTTTQEAAALRAEIEQLATAADERREAEAVATRKAAQAAVNTWLETADEALRAGRFDDALKALEDVDPSVATAAQAARFRGAEA